jgi:uncharacterized protein (TIRG00374 family)
MQLAPGAKTAVKTLITFSLLGFLLFQLDWKSIQKTLAQADLTLLLLSLFLFCLRSLFGACRWKELLRAKRHVVSILSLTKYYFIGIFFNFFFPTVVGGDLARGYYLHSQGVSKKVTASSIIVERVLGVFSLVSLSCFSLVANVHFFHNTAITAIVVIAALCSVGAFFLLFYSRAENLVRRISPKALLNTAELGIKLLEDIRGYRETPQALVYGFCISLLFQGLGIYATYLIGVSLGSSTTIVPFFTLLPIVWLISMIPVSLNGLGVREGAFVYLFALVGMQNEIAMAISLVFVLQGIVQGIIGSVLFVLDKREIARIKDYK